MSQQEDDLRALAKIMDFLRAVSIILVVMNVYWFCYEAIRLWGVSIGLLDRFSSGTQSHGELHCRPCHNRTSGLSVKDENRQKGLKM
mgnify:CR=1 FL=1